MARRGKPPRGVAGRARGEGSGVPVLNAPFAGLGKRLGREKTAPPTVSPRPADPQPAPSRDVREVDDASLFASAMDGVSRITARPDDRLGTGAARTPPRVRTDEEGEALAVLSDLVAGTGTFDITETREYLEGLAAGVDPRLVRKLRRGEFAWQGHLDLHGKTVATARTAVEAFMTSAIRAGHRCVLIVHGRGLNSKDQTPVLKERLKAWLSYTRLASHVLAFATARPADGGAGALYVLLRRVRRRRPIHVTDGAKR
jgi:DNA-nicking Smr family endonuclease